MLMTSQHQFPIVEGARSGHPASAPLDREEARRLCQLTLAGASSQKRSLLVEVDARGTHLIAAAGDEPIAIWTLGLDGLEDDRTFADALGRARLGLLRGWFQRGLLILGLPGGDPQTRRHQTSVLRALKEFLGLTDGEAALAGARAA
jgi:hypothetical protein